MSRMIGYCGLVCTDCPAFLATKDNDDVARAKTAALYAEEYGFDLKPEEINCDGCKSTTGRLLAYCSSCPIKQCCSKKSLDNCATCKDQPCNNLVKLHEFSSKAQASFELLQN